MAMLGAQRPPARDPQGRDLNIARLPGSCVLANVYDLGASSALKKTNNLSRMLGGGVYHAGVEVYGSEWSYGYIEWGTGVHKCVPRATEGHTYRATQKMGYTRLTQESVGKLLERMKGEWLGKDYQFLEHNCLSFCSAFLQALGLGRLPPWVDRYGRTACKVTSAIPVSGLVKAASLVRVAAGGTQDDHQEVHYSPRYTPEIRRTAAGHLDSSGPSLLRAGKRIDADAAAHTWARAQASSPSPAASSSGRAPRIADQGASAAEERRDPAADLRHASRGAQHAVGRGPSRREAIRPKDEGAVVESELEADAGGPDAKRRPVRRKPGRKPRRPACAGAVEAAAPQAAEQDCAAGAPAGGGEGASEAAAPAAAGLAPDGSWPLPPDGLPPAPLVPAASPVAPMLLASHVQLSTSACC